jgi:hypothetical protein
LYAIEEAIRGEPPPRERLWVQQEQARPLFDAMKGWLRGTVITLSRKSDTTAAILYALNRRQALMHYCDNGAIENDNVAAERAVRVRPWAERTSCSPVETRAVSVRQQCTRSLARPN